MFAKPEYRRTLARMQTARRAFARKASFMGFLPSQMDSYKYKEEIMLARYYRIPALIARWYGFVMLACFGLFVLCGAILASQSDLSLNLDYNQFRLNNDPITTNADLQLAVLAQLSLAKASKKPATLGVHMPLLDFQEPIRLSGRSLQSSRKLLAYSNDHFVLIYHRKTGGNLLTQAYLQQAYELETHALSQMQWTKYCVVDTTKPQQCSSKEGTQSIFNYIVQAGGYVPGINFTDTSNPYLQTAIAGFKPFFDVRYSATNTRSEYLLTFLTTDHARSHSSNMDLFNSFDTLLSDLQDGGWEGQSGWPDLELIWFGGEIATYEFLTALKHDLWFAALSFALVFGYGLLHTGSVFLTSLGLLGVIMSFPITVLLTMATFSTNFGFMDIMSLWIMAGIGIDNIFVFLDAWKSTPRYDVFNRQVSYAHRLSTTFKKATPAMFSCTVTTGGAFFADFVTSRITPISEFGFFMAIVIFYNYLMVMTWFPAVIICYEQLPFCCARYCCCYKKRVKEIETEDKIRRKLFVQFLWQHSARRALAQSRGHGDSVKKNPTSPREVALLPLTTSPYFFAPHHTGKAKLMLCYGNWLFRLRFVVLLLTLIIVCAIGSQLAYIGTPEGLPQLLPEESNFEKIRMVQTAINVKGYIGGSAAGGGDGGTTGSSGNITFSEYNGVRTGGPVFIPSQANFLALYDTQACGPTPTTVTGPPLLTLQSGNCNSFADCAPFPYLLPFIGTGGYVPAALPPVPLNVTCATNVFGGVDVSILYPGSPTPAYEVAALTQIAPKYWIAVGNTQSISRDVILHVDPGLLRANQQYAFRVAAVGYPSSLASVLSNLCMPTGVVPLSVAGIGISAPDATTVSVQWTLPTNFDGGLDLTGIEVETNGISVVLPIGSTPPTSWSKTNASPQTSYTVRIRGVNSLGSGPFMQASVTTPPRPPDPPVFNPVIGRRLLSVERHARQLLAADPNCYPGSVYPYPTQYLAWNAPNLNDNTMTVGGYQVRILTPSGQGFSCPSNIWLAYDDQSANPTPNCNVNVVFNVALSAQVRVKNSQVWSNWSNVASLPVQYSTPETPQNLRIGAQDAAGITLAWDAATNNDVSTLTYTLAEQSSTVASGITALSYSRPAVASPTSFTLAACNSRGCSPASAPLSANPYVGPTSAPTRAPTPQPTTSQPTSPAPTNTPTTVQPTTSAPTNAPTTSAPTIAPTTPPPTDVPTAPPPSVAPASPAPTNSAQPTQAPTAAPSQAPTPLPTLAPTMIPTRAPSAPPTLAPTAAPTMLPTNPPTPVPTPPSLAPTTRAPTTSQPTTRQPSVAVPTPLPTFPTPKTPTSSPTTRAPSLPPTAPTPEPPSTGGQAVSLQASMEVVVTYGVAGLDISTRIVGDAASVGTPILYSGFDPSVPAAQIFLRDLCDKLLNDTELDIRPFVEGSRCVFWQFAKAQTQFPIPDSSDFYSALISFLSTNTGFKYDIGFAGNASKLTYVSVRALTRVANNLGPSSMEVIYSKWKARMDELNAAAPVSVGSGYASADPWPQMAVENHFIESTKEAIIISLAICFTALAVFTENIYLAIFTTFFLLLECFFMLGVFGSLRWTLGAVEAVSLSIIIGLSVDYFLHTAHWYSRTYANTRKKKTLEMLSKIGFSILSAAVVAILACGVLTFCYLHVFSRVGSIISGTILTAVCLSLASLTALLFVIGPQYRNGWVGKLCRRFTKTKRHDNLRVNTVLQLQMLLSHSSKRKDDEKEDGQQNEEQKHQAMEHQAIELQPLQDVPPSYAEIYSVPAPQDISPAQPHPEPYFAVADRPGEVPLAEPYAPVSAPQNVCSVEEKAQGELVSPPAPPQGVPLMDAHEELVSFPAPLNAHEEPVSPVAAPQQGQAILVQVSEGMELFDGMEIEG